MEAKLNESKNLIDKKLNEKIKQSEKEKLKLMENSSRRENLSEKMREAKAEREAKQRQLQDLVSFPKFQFVGKRNTGTKKYSSKLYGEN